MLLEIIKKLAEVLNCMDDSRELIFGHNLRIALHAAWRELDGRRGSIRTLCDRLESPDYVQIDDLHNAGLTGKQLRPKHIGFLDSYRQLNKLGGIPRLKGVLRWGKTILGSIATMVPGIKEAAEIIKEYIEAAEIGIDKAEEN